MKNIYKKIHAVMCDTEALSKDMEIGFGNNKYKAISEASVLNLVKPLLKKHGLILYPLEVSSEEQKETFFTAKGEASRLMTIVKATYRIADIESGEHIDIQTVGNGVDNQDKGSGKAMTYAYKALLQKTFMLFSGEDTDNTHSDEITEKNTRAKGIDDKTLSTIMDLIAVAEDDKLEEKIIKGYKVDDLKQLTEKQAQTVIKTLNDRAGKK